MKLATDSLWMLLARFGTQGMAALFTILLARRLGSAGFGEYSVIAAVVFIGNMLTTFGTDMTLIREIAARNDLSMIPSALMLQLVLSLLFIGMTWGVASLFFKENIDARYALRLYVFALIPLSFFTTFTSVLRGRQLADAYTALNLIGSSLQLILVWGFIGSGSTMMRLVLLLLVSQAVVAIVGAFLCHWKVEGFWRDWKFDRSNIIQLARGSAPLAVLTVIAMFQQRLSLLMVSSMGGSAVTGLFSASQRMVEAAKTGHGATFTAMYPEMAREDVKEERLGRMFLLLVAGAVAGAVVLSVWAMPLVRILFGAGYEASVPALQILAWTLIPYTANTYLTLKFVAMKNERPVLRSSLAGLFVLIALGFWWIPKMGIVGAGGAALVSELTQTMFLFLQWRAK